VAIIITPIGLPELYQKWRGDYTQPRPRAKGQLFFRGILFLIDCHSEAAMIRKLKPGQAGTKKLTQQYGDRLVCVRYRYDAHTRKCRKTVELIVEESDWPSPVPDFADDEIVWLRTGFVDRTQQQRLGAAGAKWDGKRCVWLIKYRAAVALGFAAHVERRDVSL
jgi:hypothetical protein